MLISSLVAIRLCIVCKSWSCVYTSIYVINIYLYSPQGLPVRQSIMAIHTLVQSVWAVFDADQSAVVYLPSILPRANATSEGFIVRNISSECLPTNGMSWHRGAVRVRKLRPDRSIPGVNSFVYQPTVCRLFGGDVPYFTHTLGK